MSLVLCDDLSEKMNETNEFKSKRKNRLFAAIKLLTNKLEWDFFGEGKWLTAQAGWGFEGAKMSNRTLTIADEARLSFDANSQSLHKLLYSFY